MNCERCTTSYDNETTVQIKRGYSEPLRNAAAQPALTLLAELEKDLCVISEAFAEMRSRIGPCLSAPPPAICSAVAMRDGPPETDSPLVRKLVALRVQSQDIQDFVRETLSLVQL